MEAKRYVRWGAVALCLTFALSACGGSASQSSLPSRSDEAAQVAEVLRTLRAYYRASLTRDSATSCTLMSRGFLAAWRDSAGGQECSAAMDEIFLNLNPKSEAELRQLIRELKPDSVFVTGNAASLEVPGERADLVREDGEWLVSGTYPANAREITFFSAAQLEVELKDYFEGGGNIVTVNTAICPPNEPVKVGNVFECVVEFGGGSKALTSIEVRDLRGDYKIFGFRSLPD